MKYYFIFNPGSRNGKSKKMIEHIQSLLDEENIEYDYEMTQTLDDAYWISQRANQNDYDVIVAVGGDGTINKVLNGFYDQTGKRISKARMGVIYTGTSPDFCKSYHVPYKSIDTAVHTLIKGHSQKIHIGKIHMHALDSTRYFACCVNIGLGASVARFANSGIRKKVGDLLGTFIALVKAFIHGSPSDLEVSIDQNKKTITKTYNIFIGKTYHVASGIKIPNALQEGDGRFYILTVRNVHWTDIPYCLKTLYSGRAIFNSETIYLEYGRHMEISGQSEIEFDGDPQGFLPCRIEMAKDTLELINEPDE